VPDGEASLNKKLAAYVRQHDLLRAGDRLGVAVSGGADSTALLRLLLELRAESGVVLSVVHFNHLTRGAASDGDAEFTRELAERFGLEFHLGAGDAPRQAREQRLGLEAAARQLRYGFFRQLLASQAVGKIATAHTLDDQAETVLLRLIRGAGTKGLAGIYPRLPIGDRDPADQRFAGRDFAGTRPLADAGQIVRPLLAVTRREVEQYLKQAGQCWCEDASNRDLRHARNRVRHRLLPLLEQEFNPSIRQVLADTAEVARVEEDYWHQVIAAASPIRGGGAGQEPAPYSPGGQDSAARDMVTMVEVARLLESPPALRRRWLLAVLQDLGIAPELHITQALLALAGMHNGARIELPGGWIAYRALGKGVMRAERAAAECADQADRNSPDTRRGPVLCFERAAKLAAGGNFAYTLPVPGSVEAPGLGVTFRASVVPLTLEGRAYNRSCLLARHLGRELQVRNWRPGDRFGPLRGRSAAKVKELLQARHISGPERVVWPVVVNPAGELVWMRGFDVPDLFVPAADAAEAILIEEEEERLAHQ
jgi:tRNA(Ile)-lysidine synthase